ncbi:MAG: hypothetical protein V4547_16005 [Bacteroidota bacterium]
MKKVKQIGFIMLIGISTAMINGCAKDGATGPAGTAGTNGNANVLGSNSISVISSDWTLSNGFYSTSFTLPVITQSIVDKGVVIVYEKLGSSMQCMPYTNGFTERDFTFNVGSFKVWSHETDGSAPTNPGAQTYRAVVISASNLIAHPNVDFKNYQMVKTTFNLPN